VRLKATVEIVRPARVERSVPAGKNVDEHIFVKALS
jgi:hypothetical protein